MFFHAFQQLSVELQLYYVLKLGSFLAYRKQEQGEVVLYLYYFPDGGRGFFVELGVDKGRDCFFIIGSFNDSRMLQEYTQGVRLPE